MDLEDRQSKGTIKTRYIPNHPDLEDVVYGGLNVREPSSESIQAWLIQVSRRVMRHRCFRLGIPSSEKKSLLTTYRNSTTRTPTRKSIISEVFFFSRYQALQLNYLQQSLSFDKLVSCESIAFSMFCQDTLHEACQTMG